MESTVIARSMSAEEEKLQAACYQWFHNTFPLWRKMLFHVDNNSWNKVIGSRKKALGVNSGVSDFILVTWLEVIFIEMKTPIGEQNDEQIIFEERVKRRGHKYVIIRTLEEFKKFITQKIAEAEEYL